MMSEPFFFVGQQVFLVHAPGLTGQVSAVDETVCSEGICSLVLVQWEDGSCSQYNGGVLRPLPFRRFLFRRAGFGKTPWRRFIGLQLLLLCVISAGIITREDAGLWVAVPFWVIVNGVGLRSTWLNFKGRQG